MLGVIISVRCDDQCFPRFSVYPLILIIKWINKDDILYINKSKSFEPTAEHTVKLESRQLIACANINQSPIVSFFIPFFHSWVRASASPSRPPAGPGWRWDPPASWGLCRSSADPTATRRINRDIYSRLPGLQERCNGISIPCYLRGFFKM